MKNTGDYFRHVHALWAWKRKAGIEVPSRRLLKRLALRYKRNEQALVNK